MAIYTPVSACNMALSLVADEAAQITSIPATPSEKYSKEANLCAKFFEITLREVLAATEWKFARKRKALALLPTTPEFEWQNEFEFPADCNRPLVCMPTQSTNRSYIYKAEWDTEGRKVVTNKGEMWMLYIKNVTNLNDADPLFFKTLYSALSTKLSFVLTEDRNLKKDLMNQYTLDVLPEARRVNGYSGHILPSIDSAWLEAMHRSNIYDNVQRFDLQDNYGTI